MGEGGEEKGEAVKGVGGEARRAWCRGFLHLGLHCVRLLPSLTWFPQQTICSQMACKVKERYV